jgi:pSer/pThr/pTyr-binding forkhead associated (FHA) protein
MGQAPPASGPAPALAVTNPSGNRSRVAIDAVPFLIGRQGENNLVLRDNRISRSHARIAVENGEYVVEDWTAATAFT